MENSDNRSTAYMLGYDFGKVAYDLYKGFIDGWDESSKAKLDETTFARRVIDEVLTEMAKESREAYIAHKTYDCAPPERDTVTEKTQIGDCRRCYCDSCTRLEFCDICDPGSASLELDRPAPCLGCTDGLRFMPVEGVRCAEYEKGEGLQNNG